MRVKVRAVIWIDGRLVAHREYHLGHERVTLPGGRIKDRETAEEALVREVREEVGLDVTVGPLLYVAEVVSAFHMQELELVFRAEPAPGQPLDALALVDADGPERDRVLPPILATIARDARGGRSASPRWLGNIHASGLQG